MYKITVKNLETGIMWKEYGFSKFMMKRIHFLFNDCDETGYENYEVLEIMKICLTWDTFKKCFLNKAEIIFKK